MRCFIHFEIVQLHVDAKFLAGDELRVHLRPHFGGAEHKLAGANLLERNGLDLVGQNQRAGGKRIVVIARHGQCRADDPDVAAIHVFDDDVQAVAARPQGHCLLINGMKFQRGFQERIREVSADRIFKGLHHAAGKRSNPAEDVQCGRVHTVLILEGELAIGNLDGNGNQHGIAGDAQKVIPVVELYLVPHNSRGDDGFQILVLDFRRALNLGIELKPVEFVHAGGLAAQTLPEVRAVGVGEPVGLVGHAH